MTYAAQGNKDTAQRIVNAHLGFVETLERCGNITEKQAISVKDYYLKNKLAKLDAVSGRITVKHGAFLDADVIQRAAII